MVKARLYFRDDPSRKFELEGGQICIGRSPDCDIVISDPYVSRRQLLATISSQGAVLKNIGSNPARIAGREIPPGKSATLHNLDEIRIGKTVLVASVEEPSRKQGSSGQTPIVQEEQTVLLSTPSKARGPSIVVSGPSGDRTVELARSPMTIGRAGEADICLSDRTVSRHHAVIERRSDGFYIKGVSTVNPVVVNGRKVKEARLYSGDQIRIGVFSLAFLSDDSRDLRPARHGSSGTSHGRLFVLWAVAALLILAAGSYLFYFQVYRPWSIRKGLKEASLSMQQGDSAKAERLLKEMLSKGLPEEYSSRARRLLARSILAQAERLFTAGETEGAQALLISFLKKYGTGPDTLVVWDRLDQYRLGAARALEKDGKFLAAMKKYSLVEKDSPYYEEAQKRIGRIWLEFQKEKLKKQTIYQLMQKAEQAFRDGHYLTPVNQNAFAAYQAILSMDPSNRLARKRIREIMDIFMKKGQEALAQKDYQEALGYFERCLLIDPESKRARKLAAECQTHLSASGHASATERQKERVKKLLKESGTESSWIMKYLFDEKGKDTETPW